MRRLFFIPDSVNLIGQAPAHFRVKAAALREIRQFNISDESERTGRRQKEIQKPWVFGGVLSPISFAAERNGAAGGKYAEALKPQVSSSLFAAAGKTASLRRAKHPRAGWRQ